MAAGTKFLQDYYNAVKGNVRIQDDIRLLPYQEIERAVRTAIRVYNSDKPRELVATVNGDDSSIYATPTGWVVGASFIDKLIFPIDDAETNDDDKELDPDDDYFVRTVDESTQKIVFKGAEPSSTGPEQFRVFYTGQHSVTATTSTIPDTDFDGVVAWATAYVSRIMASYYAQTQDPTLLVDSADYGGRAAVWVELANHWFAVYRNALGIGDDTENTGADAFVDWDVLPPRGGDFLFHPRFQR